MRNTPLTAWLFDLELFWSAFRGWLGRRTLGAAALRARRQASRYS